MKPRRGKVVRIGFENGAVLVMGLGQWVKLVDGKASRFDIEAVRNLELHGRRMVGTATVERVY